MIIDDRVRKWIEDHDCSEYCEYCIWNMDCTGETACKAEGPMEPPCCAYDDPAEYLNIEGILDDMEQEKFKEGSQYESMSQMRPEL